MLLAAGEVDASHRVGCVWFTYHIHTQQVLEVGRSTSKLVLGFLDHTEREEGEEETEIVPSVRLWSGWS